MALSFKIYQGTHSKELFSLLKQCWESGAPLLVCPPYIKDLSALQNIQIPDQTILAVYTSGTLSGRPRLIFYSRKNIESSLAAIRKLYDVKKIDQIFCYPQPTHTFGLTLGYLQALLFDIPLVFHEGSYSSAAHEKWLECHSPGLMTLGTPTHLMDLAHYVKKNKIKPKTSYTVILGGAPVTQKLWHQMREELHIEQPSIGYGATEASPGLMHLAPGISPLMDGDIGSVLSGVQIHQMSPAGFSFSGDNQCLAVLDEKGLQRLEKIEIRDILEEVQQGRYVFKGRSDLLVNRGGLKLSPELIEGKISSDLGLKVACVSFFSERLGEDLGLMIQLQEEFSGEIILEKVQKILKNNFSIHLPVENIIFKNIPLNSSAKFDRIEIIKWILKYKKLKFPISVDYFRPFLPHRPPAIWVHRITDYNAKGGHVEVDLLQNSNAFTNKALRESACIELVAQTYAYCKAGYEISALGEPQSANEKANKTLIAEIRQAEFFFSPENEDFLLEAMQDKTPLQIEALCTHDFGLLRVIRGSVHIKNKKLAELSLKAFISPE